MRIVFVIYIIGSIYPHNLLAKTLSLESKIEAINKTASDSFGVSLKALAYLLGISESSYLRQDSFKASVNIALINELKLKGYVQIHYQVGLPDGTGKGVRFIRLAPTCKGHKIIEHFNGIADSRTVESMKQLLSEIERGYEEELVKVEKEIKDLERRDLEKNDLNHDGVRDLFYEESADSYFQLVDRNFDGRVDERWQYDLEDNLMAGSSDDDFDGTFETKYVSQYGYVIKQFVDTDGNGISDVYYEYKFGVWLYSEKYYPSSSAQGARIGKVEFGIDQITDDEIFLNTDISEIEFQNARMKNRAFLKQTEQQSLQRSIAL